MLRASVASEFLSQLNTDGVLATLYALPAPFSCGLTPKRALAPRLPSPCRLLDAKGEILAAACPPDLLDQQKSVAAIFSNIWTEYTRASNSAFGSSSVDEELQMLLFDLEVCGRGGTSWGEAVTDFVCVWMEWFGEEEVWEESAAVSASPILDVRPLRLLAVCSGPRLR